MILDDLMNNQKVMDSMSASVKLMEQPPIKESLNQVELESPIPDFSTIENIKNLSDTQVLLALQIFIYRLNFDYDIYEKDAKLKLFGGTVTPLPLDSRHPEIINANIPQLVVMLKIFKEYNSYIIPSKMNKMLKAYRQDNSSVSLPILVNSIRLFLMRASNFWDEEANYLRDAYDDKFKTKYNISEYYIFNSIPQQLFTHPIISYSFFNDKGKLRKRGVLNLFKNFMMKYRISYYYENNLDYSIFLNKMLNSLNYRTMSKNELYSNFINKFYYNLNWFNSSRMISGEDDFIIKANDDFSSLARRFIQNYYIMSKFDYIIIHEIVKPKILSLGDLDELISFLRDYFNDFYQYLNKISKNDKDFIDSLSSSSIIDETFMPHFIQVIVHYLTILGDKKENTPMSWFCEQNYPRFDIAVPVSIYTDEKNLIKINELITLLNDSGSYKFYIRH